MKNNLSTHNIQRYDDSHLLVKTILKPDIIVICGRVSSELSSIHAKILFINLHNYIDYPEISYNGEPDYDEMSVEAEIQRKMRLLFKTYLLHLLI